MGYFDDAKASREEENTLEHSSGAWKKHKYIRKVTGENGKTRYVYTSDSEVVSESNAKNKSKQASDLAKAKARVLNGNKMEGNQSDFGTSAWGPYQYYFDKDADGDLTGLNKDIREAERQGRNAAYETMRKMEKTSKSAEEQYKRDKPVAYRVDQLATSAKNTVNKGKSLIKDFFTPKTKVTASSNLTGKENINTKPAEKVTLKKNKLSFKKN